MPVFRRRGPKNCASILPMMLFKRPDTETLYSALVNKDPAYEGVAYVCVTSTKIFCRFTCTARKPKIESWKTNRRGAGVRRMWWRWAMIRPPCAAPSSAVSA